VILGEFTKVNNLMLKIGLRGNQHTPLYSGGQLSDVWLPRTPGGHCVPFRSVLAGHSPTAGYTSQAVIVVNSKFHETLF